MCNTIRYHTCVGTLTIFRQCSIIANIEYFWYRYNVLFYLRSKQKARRNAQNIAFNDKKTKINV